MVVDAKLKGDVSLVGGEWKRGVGMRKIGKMRSEIDSVVQETSCRTSEWTLETGLMRSIRRS